MKVEEAIKYIEQHGFIADDVKDMAIKAIEKQIPKKPKFVDVRFRHHGKNIGDGCSLDKCYKCPNCKSHIFHVFASEEYCERCGQRLDWGE